MIELKPIGFIGPSIQTGAGVRVDLEMPFPCRLAGLRMADAGALVIERVTVFERQLLPCEIPVHTFAGLLAEQLRPFVGANLGLSQGMIVSLYFRNDGAQPERPKGALLVEAAP